MKTSKTALAAAAFGVAVMIAPASAEEIKYNFTSEFSNKEVAAGGRASGVRSFSADGKAAGPEVAQSIMRLPTIGPARGCDARCRADNYRQWQIYRANQAAERYSGRRGN